jgi:hypothetical protein
MGKYGLCFFGYGLVYCCATSPGGRGRDSRIYLDHQDRRGEEEPSFKPFAFSRSRFLCAGTMVLGRGHGKALRRAWDNLFLLLHFLVLSFLLCVHDGVIGRAFYYSSLGYEMHAIHELIIWIQIRDSCDLIGIMLIHFPVILSRLAPGYTLSKMRRVSCTITVYFIEAGIEETC